MRSTHAEDGSARSFTVRLIATVALTLTLISVAGYLLLAGALSGSHLSGATLHDVRLDLGLIALLAPAGGTAIFCLLGGGRLLREHRRALSRATRDGLTELPNRSAFDDELPDAVAASIRYGQPLALLLAEIDDLELIGRRHGHRESDTTLRVAAGVLRSARASDRPYRIAGDGFALLLVGTDADGARPLVRRLAASFAQAGVQLSIGASALRPGQSAETLRAEAETALYVAKSQGHAVHFDELQVLAPAEDSPVLAGARGPSAGGEL
jgi:diguanylate cyclase (GGDEF)-like protein